MRKITAAFALLLPLAALGASGCTSTPARPYIPPRSCLGLAGDAYANCNNRESERTENMERNREAVMSLRGMRPVAPRKCVPNGYGGFDCK